MEDNNQTNTTPSVSEGNATPAVTPATVTPTAETVSEMTVTTTTEPAPVATEVSSVEVIPDVVTEPAAEAASTPDVAVEAATPAPAVDESATKALRAAMIKQYAIACGIILVMAGGVTYVLEQQGRIQTHVFDKVTALVNPVPVAVVVNGVKIPLSDYEKNKTQLEQAAMQNGSDVSSSSTQEQIKGQALDVLINTELLRQEATKEVRE